MKCGHVNRLPIYDRQGRRLGAPSVGKCEREVLPGMTGCSEHVTREAMAYWIRELHSRLLKCQEGAK